MKLELEFYRALCSASLFKINGIDAEYEDFGDKGDASPDEAEPYGCGDMTFTPKESTKKILKKYKISQKEYDKIAEKLTSGLSFGDCGWCV